jgi:hypothetical protein
MELEDKELLKLDLMGAINTMGTAEVLKALSESLRGVGGRRFSDWDKDLHGLADSLDTLAKRAADFEEHYGAREP